MFGIVVCCVRVCEISEILWAVFQVHTFVGTSPKRNDSAKGITSPSVKGHLVREGGSTFIGPKMKRRHL